MDYDKTSAEDAQDKAGDQASAADAKELGRGKMLAGMATGAAVLGVPSVAAAQQRGGRGRGRNAGRRGQGAGGYAIAPIGTVDLDSVCGGGPAASPILYESDDTIMLRVLVVSGIALPSRRGEGEFVMADL